jgi:hypothetical protein
MGELAPEYVFLSTCELHRLPPGTYALCMAYRAVHLPSGTQVRAVRCKGLQWWCPLWGQWRMCIMRHVTRQ